MNLLERFFNQPGYYELVGGPQSGKTTVGLLLTLSKRVAGRAWWLTTSQEYSQVLMETVGPSPGEIRGYTVEHVEVFFEFVSSEAVERRDFIILDSLATLEADHPGSRQIGPSVTRHYVEPRCPVLVINQERWPSAPGGLRWRSGLSGRFKLVKIRDRPFLLSKLEPTELFLTWASGYPELRVLSREEKELWLPTAMYRG